MSSAAKRTNYSTPAAHATFGTGLISITGEKLPLRLTECRYASYTTKRAETNRMHFAGRNTSRPRMESGTLKCGAGITSQAKEGFERTHLQEKIQFYNVARGSAGEVRSLLYVVSDNFAEATAEAERLRDEVTRVGKLVTGLLNSTVRRRCIVPRAILALLSPISYLLTSISFHLR